MSLSQAMSIALTGMRASTQLIGIASNNISNAQTEGYTAKTATIRSVEYANNPGGVEVTGYTRAADQALTENFNTATSQSAYYGTQHTYMSQMQAILDSSSDTPALTDDIAQFASAWSQFSANPESSIEQQNVISVGNKLAKEINSITADVGALKTQIQTDIQNDVSGLNTALDNIATINQQIQAATSSGRPIADLQDKLDVAISKVAGYTAITIQTRSSNQVAIYTPSGQPLVDGINPSTYTYNGTAVLDSNGNDITSTISGGSIQASIDFISSTTGSLASTITGVGTLEKFKKQLSTLCDAFTGSSGAPSAFATAYTNARTTSTSATGTQNGATVANTFFTVTNNASGMPDTSTFSVNTTLLSNSAVLPQTGTAAIASSFDTTASYSTSGLSVASATYSQLGSAILTGMQQSANSIKTDSTTATNLATYYKAQVTNTTGVNLDTELANLTMFQNSYAASAHVISTINQMMQTLLSVVS